MKLPLSVCKVRSCLEGRLVFVSSDRAANFLL